MGSSLCTKLLNNIGTKSDNIRKLKVEHLKIVSDTTHHRRMFDHACFKDCNGFSKIEILKLTGNPKLSFGFGLVLKEVILDMNEEHVKSFKKCLKCYENKEMKLLNVFELIVRTQKPSVVTDGNIDGDIFDSKDLSRLTQFMLNVSKLKIHCPYINKFNLL